MLLQLLFLHRRPSHYSCCCPLINLLTRSFQIHDEVIFEGPEETAEEAEAIIVHIMENPWDELGMLPLKVKLTVDSSHAPNWYLAK